MRTACLHLQMDHRLPHREEPACEAGETCLWPPNHQHLLHIKVCSFPSAPLPVHQQLHIKTPVCQLLNFADNTTFIKFIFDGDESTCWWETGCPGTWCSQNSLELNCAKTVVIIEHVGNTVNTCHHRVLWDLFITIWHGAFTARDKCGHHHSLSREGDWLRHSITAGPESSREDGAGASHPGQKLFEKLCSGKRMCSTSQEHFLHNHCWFHQHYVHVSLLSLQVWAHAFCIFMISVSLTDILVFIFYFYIITIPLIHQDKCPVCKNLNGSNSFSQYQRGITLVVIANTHIRQYFPAHIVLNSIRTELFTLIQCLFHSMMRNSTQIKSSVCLSISLFVFYDLLFVQSWVKVFSYTFFKFSHSHLQDMNLLQRKLNWKIGLTASLPKMCWGTGITDKQTWLTEWQGLSYM